MADDQIIIIKKKGGHGGHHGGAWKVAYADFVTAMMALFIVLWLMNSASKPAQEAIAGYFRDPHGVADKKGTMMGGAGDSSAVKKEDMSKLKEQLLQSLKHTVDLDKLKDQIEMTVTPEGLRIEMLENSQGTFFENGKADPTATLKDILKVLSAEIAKLPNSISVEGHTDARPYSTSGGYSNWELSTDRANMARRLMESDGARKDQVAQVRGFADRQLRRPDQPQDASNRRISIIVQYLAKPNAGPNLIFDGKLPTAAETAGPPAAAKPKETAPEAKVTE